MSHEYRVRIENTKGTCTKYEYNKDTDSLDLDRMIQSSSAYRFDYGYIEDTLGGDGDPLDAIVLCSEILVPNCVVLCRPIGMLDTEDEKGRDEKIIMVPVTKVDPKFRDVVSINQKIICEEKPFIKHFFERYKENEPGKECIVKDFHEGEEVIKTIDQGIKDHEEEKKMHQMHLEKLRSEDEKEKTIALKKHIYDAVDEEIANKLDSLVDMITDRVISKLTDLKVHS